MSLVRDPTLPKAWQSRYDSLLTISGAYFRRLLSGGYIWRSFLESQAKPSQAKSNFPKSFLDPGYFPRQSSVLDQIAPVSFCPGHN
jgi:hypothetical protein